jgi:hypothetical protein
MGTPAPVQLLAGSHVGLLSRARVLARGLLETVTADGSTAWIWLEGGGGRRMIHAGDGIDLLILEEAPDPAHTTEAKNTKPKTGVTTEGN